MPRTRARILKSTREKVSREEIKAADSYQNFSLNIGMGTNNALSDSTYGFNPITRIPRLLEFIHRGSWIGGIAVDSVADDMVNGGIDIFSGIDPNKIEHITQQFVELDIWNQLSDAIKWSRLYGGAIAFMMIEGQDPSTPLRIETIGKGQFKGLAIFDRWQTEPSLTELVTDFGPYFGLPKYYKINNDSFAMMNLKVHYTRCFRFEGLKLPHWQRIQENLWGLSVLERLYDRLIAFDSATNGMAQTIHKSSLRIYKMFGLNEAMAAGQEAEQIIYRKVEMMRRLQSSEGVTMLDANDDFIPHTVNVTSGIVEGLMQIGQQISGSLQIPLVRLFGQSPAGLNSTGESDLRTYYDNIKNQQKRHMQIPIQTIIQAICASDGIKLDLETFGFSFNPLWHMSESEKTDINEKDTNTVLAVLGAGAIDLSVALRELRERGNITGRWDNITDEIIEQAEQMPEPGMENGGEDINYNQLIKEAFGEVQKEQVQNLQNEQVE